MGAYQRYKKKTIKKTTLFFGEGLLDYLFLRYLKSIYSSEKINITIRRGRGGDAKKIVKDCIKVFGDFNKRAVLLDNDKPAKEVSEARKIAKEKNIVAIENTPCLEALFLSILDKDYENKNTKWCKKEFKKHHKKEIKVFYDFNKIFPKETIEEKKERINNLKLIIEILTK